MYTLGATSLVCNVKSFLQRNLHNCPPSIIANCYASLIKPISCVVWAPHTNKDISFIESVQRRADFKCHWNVTSKIKLEATGTLPKSTKSHHHVQDHPQSNWQVIEIPTNTHLIPLSSDYNTRGHQWRFKQPMIESVNVWQCDGRAAMTSPTYTPFFPSTIKIWNSLSPTLSDASTTL